MSNLPAYLQNLPSRNLAQTAIANVGAGNPPYLSIESNRFTLVDVAGNTVPIQTLYVDVVIVDINDHVSKIYFDPGHPYDPNNPTPPLCFSDNGVAPSTAAGHPQAPTCASCPNNVWGSKISQLGSAVKACADQQKIAIYLPEYSEGMFLLRIPPGSFVNWRAYMAKFANAKLDPDRVITRIGFQQGVNGVLTFQSPGYITEQMVGMVGKMIESRAADMLIGRLDRPRENIPAVAFQPPQGQLPPPSQQLQAQVQQGPLPAPSAVLQPTSFLPPQTVTMPTLVPAQTAQTQQPAQQPRKRGRRPAAETQQPPAQQQPPQAPFRAQPAPSPQQMPFQPDPAPAVQHVGGDSNVQFGIAQQAPPPPPGLDLDAVFK